MRTAQAKFSLKTKFACCICRGKFTESLRKVKLGSFQKKKQTSLTRKCYFFVSEYVHLQINQDIKQLAT